MRCPFCLRADRPMTREHVFAHWLVRQVHGGRLVPSASTRGEANVAPLRIARVVTSVCADCNAGWMSSLEVAFRRVLFARRRSGPIPAADRVILARWLTKTAVLLTDAQGASLEIDAVANRSLTYTVSGSEGQRLRVMLDLDAGPGMPPPDR